MVIRGVDPWTLRAGRVNLVIGALMRQRRLAAARITRHTMIKVTADGVLWDGNHAVKVAMELNRAVDIEVVKGQRPDCGLVADLPVTPR